MALQVEAFFSCEDCFGFWPFGLKVFILILSTKRESWLKSISEKWAILVNVPQGINQGDFKISRSWGFVWFKGFGWLEAVASLDAYQITNY